MHIEKYWTVLGVASCCLFSLGCGGGEAEVANAPDPVEATEDGIKRRAAEDLPAVADFLPALDDGKVEIAGPEGWILLPNTGKQLAAFASDKARAYPRINVTAADSPLPVLGDLTEENASQFATVFDDSYKKKRKSLPESAKPIVLGGTLYLRQVRLVSINKKQLVMQSLATVQKGRLYTVELFCEVDPARPEDYATPLTEARDYAYAVAAHLSPIAAATETPATPAETAPAEAKPDDAKPAEAPPAEKTEDKSAEKGEAA